MLSEGRNSTPNHHVGDLDFQSTTGKIGAQKNSLGNNGKKNYASKQNTESRVINRGMSYLQALEDRRQGTPNEGRSKAENISSASKQQSGKMD